MHECARIRVHFVQITDVFTLTRKDQSQPQPLAERNYTHAAHSCVQCGVCSLSLFVCGGVVRNANSAHERYSLMFIDLVRVCHPVEARKYIGLHAIRAHRHRA